VTGICEKKYGDHHREDEPEGEEDEGEALESEEGTRSAEMISERPEDDGGGQKRRKRPPVLKGNGDDGDGDGSGASPARLRAPRGRARRGGAGGGVRLVWGGRSWPDDGEFWGGGARGEKLLLRWLALEGKG
jgi:hypothetical protein